MSSEPNHYVVNESSRKPAWANPNTKQDTIKDSQERRKNLRSQQNLSSIKYGLGETTRGMNTIAHDQEEITKDIGAILQLDPAREVFTK